MAADPLAHLVIHRPLRRHWPRRAEAMLRLVVERIDDTAPLVTVDDLGARLTLGLPSGGYRVRACLRAREVVYLLTLQPAQCLELHLAVDRA